MPRERLYLFDTTLRDGAQTNGVDFSLQDKLAIIGILDRLGVDYIEAGYPGANPLDTELFAKPRPTRARLTAFGMTRRPGRSAANDPGLADLLAAEASAICFVAKSWDHHVHVALETTLEENLASVADSLAAARARGREAMLDCEHFFDGFKKNRDYALAVARQARDSGASWVVLCDTNGGTLPHEVERVVGEVASALPGIRLGIHAHDDTGCAVANSLAAIRLVSLIATLKLKPDFAERFEIGVGDAALAELTHASRAIDEILNRAPNRYAPYVGHSAFVTKTGIHASAILKDPSTYEHVAPALVGNRRRVLVSDQAGKSNVLAELERIGINLDKNDPRLSRVLAEVKEREAQGYAYEGADASFFLLAKRILGELPDYFAVERFKVNVERRYNAVGDLVTFSEATVKVRIGDESLISAAEGNGPVNALDTALRKDLGKYQRHIENIELVDFKVRVFQGGTDAVTRVLIESRDGTGETWTTVGVSPNIIDASFQALVDSINYKLAQSGA
jgi:2-isopropylmalate synthase